MRFQDADGILRRVDTVDTTASTEISEIYEAPALIDLGTLEELTLGPVFNTCDTGLIGLLGPPTCS